MECDSRKVWLDSLSAVIDTDEMLDVSPLELIITDIGNEGILPEQYELNLANYPNPFNPETQIEFIIPEAGFVEINLYDVLGDKIDLLLNRYMSAGLSTFTFNAEGMSSGVYFCLLRYGKSVITRKLLLVK